jgi:hypothetical protein
MTFVTGLSPQIAELVINKKKIRGTLSFKTYVDSMDGTSERLKEVSGWADALVSNIGFVTDTQTFYNLVEDIGIHGCEIYLSTIDIGSRELVIKYSTDETLQGLLSGDIDQEVYDLGECSFRFDVLQAGTSESLILTLTVPF